MTCMLEDTALASVGRSPAWARWPHVRLPSGGTCPWCVAPGPVSLTAEDTDPEPHEGGSAESSWGRWSGPTGFLVLQAGRRSALAHSFCSGICRVAPSTFALFLPERVGTLQETGLFSPLAQSQAPASLGWWMLTSSSGS